MFLRNLYRTSIKLNIRNYSGNNLTKKPPKILITGKFLCYLRGREFKNSVEIIRKYFDVEIFDNKK